MLIERTKMTFYEIISIEQLVPVLSPAQNTGFCGKKKDRAVIVIYYGRHDNNQAEPDLWTAH